MAVTRKIIRIFIASPGDLADERVAAKSVVEEFNSIWAETFGYQAELVGWEDTVSMYGRPQSLINKDLEKCELFIGLLWKRWGTPPDTSGPYTSGFEEEFEISTDRRKKNGKPEISLFFKDIDPQLLLDPGEDLKKVMRFREKTIASKQILFEPFRGLEDFQSKLRRCISAYVKNLWVSESETIEDETKNSSPGSAATEQSKDSGAVLLPDETRKFLSLLLSKEQNSITRHEASRLRLIGQVVGVNGNDEQAIGVHDANTLFLDRATIEISPVEVSGLIDCGLENFRHENCPLWYWISRNSVLSRSVFSIYATFGPANRRRGALEAMALIEEPFINKPIPRDGALGRLLAEKTDSNVRVAALEYLQECGLPSDLVLLRKELERGDVQTRSAAILAVIHINMRDGAENALAALFELQPETISKKLLNSIFSTAEAVPTDRFLPGLSNRNADVRLATVKVLRSRSALINEAAESLLGDNDAKIRLEAIQSLVDAGKKYTEHEARRILVKPQKAGLFGLAEGYDGPGNDALDIFQTAQLGCLPDVELSALVQTASVYDEIPYLARATRYFEKYGDELRRNIRDEFRAHFELTIERMAGSGRSAESIEKARKLEEFLRKGMTRKALDIICDKKLLVDLALLREVLKVGAVDYSKKDIEFLRAYGEWSDIPLIIKSVGRIKYSSLLLPSDASHYRDGAHAVYQIGKARLAELLELEAPPELICRLVIVSGIKEFRALDDDLILRLLASENESLRKSISLKCIISLTKKRLGDILHHYSDGENFRYYNVIHWLDLALSVPRDRSIVAARKSMLHMN